MDYMVQRSIEYPAEKLLLLVSRLLWRQRPPGAVDWGGGGGRGTVATS